MTSYDDYLYVYLGNDIRAEDWPRIARMAEKEVERINDLYSVSAVAGITQQEAHIMAVCAVADALYDFVAEDDARGYAGHDLQDGSHIWPGELCGTTLRLRHDYIMHQAGQYLHIVRKG